MRFTIAVSVLGTSTIAAVASPAEASAATPGANAFQHRAAAAAPRGGGKVAPPPGLFHRSKRQSPILVPTYNGRNRRGRVLPSDRKLQNTHQGQASTLVECNPNSSSPDVGLLSCGLGQYCGKTDASSLGGVCTPLLRPREKNDGGRLRRKAQQEAGGGSSYSSSVNADDDDYYMMYEERVGFFGEYACGREETATGAFDGGVTCDCAGWNSETMTGSIACSVSDEYCLYGCAEKTCISFSAGYSSTDSGDGNNENNIRSYEYCYNFSEPEEQSFCRSYSENDGGTCGISLDGTSCNSCSEESDYGCLSYDCTNVGMGSTADSCEDGTYPMPPILEDSDCSFFNDTTYYYDEYPVSYYNNFEVVGSCSICPSGDGMGNPTGVVNMPVFGNMTCDSLGALADTGSFYAHSCDYLTHVAQTGCCGGDDPADGTATTNNDGFAPTPSTDDAAADLDTPPDNGDIPAPTPAPVVPAADDEETVVQTAALEAELNDEDSSANGMIVQSAAVVGLSVALTLVTAMIL